jgi:hypothetical protein
MVNADLRGRVLPHVRRGLIAVGRHFTDRHLWNLRLALSYLEIGRELSGLPASEQPVMVDTDTDLFKLALTRVTGQRPLYLEFGVFEGRSMRWWVSNLKTPGANFVGFDSFEGLPEDWHPGIGAGYFATGKPPDIPDPRVRFEVGWFDQTLPNFAAPDHDQLIINIDCDLYSSAFTALDWASPLLVSGTLLYFDEYSDRDHELRALAECKKRSAVDFVPLAFANGGVHWLFEVRDAPTPGL